MTDPKMPGEDDMIKGQQELQDGLTLIFKVFNNYLTTRVIDIEPGNTLWHLAKTLLGNGQRWRELAILNIDVLIKGTEQHKAPAKPDFIYPNTKLRIFAF